MAIKISQLTGGKKSIFQKKELSVFIGTLQYNCHSEEMSEGQTKPFCGLHSRLNWAGKAYMACKTMQRRNSEHKAKCVNSV